MTHHPLLYGVLCLSLVGCSARRDRADFELSVTRAALEARLDDDGWVGPDDVVAPEAAEAEPVMPEGSEAPTAPAEAVTDAPPAAIVEATAPAAVAPWAAPPAAGLPPAPPAPAYVPEWEHTLIDRLVDHLVQRDAHLTQAAAADRAALQALVTTLTTKAPPPPPPPPAPVDLAPLQAVADAIRTLQAAPQAPATITQSVVVTTEGGARPVVDTTTTAPPAPRATKPTPVAPAPVQPAPVPVAPAPLAPAPEPVRPLPAAPAPATEPVVPAAPQAPVEPEAPEDEPAAPSPVPAEVAPAPPVRLQPVTPAPVVVPVAPAAEVVPVVVVPADEPAAAPAEAPAPAVPEVDVDVVDAPVLEATVSAPPVVVVSADEPAPDLRVAAVVRFARGNATIAPAERSAVREVADAILQHGPARAYVTGHDDAGANPPDPGLGQRRADAVAALLRTHGVPADRIRVSNHGDEDLATADHPNADQRVFIFLESGPPFPDTEHGVRP